VLRQSSRSGARRNQTSLMPELDERGVVEGEFVVTASHSGRAPTTRVVVGRAIDVQRSSASRSTIKPLRCLMRLPRRIETASFTKLPMRWRKRVQRWEPSYVQSVKRKDGSAALNSLGVADPHITRPRTVHDLLFRCTNSWVSSTPRRTPSSETHVSDALETEFHDEMLNIYRRAKKETGYTATGFLGMVVDQGGRQAAKSLINAKGVSSGYTTLFEKRRLDLSMEAVVVEKSAVPLSLHARGDRSLREATERIRVRAAEEAGHKRTEG